MKAAVYVHIPFCRARCSYCDFNTYAGLETLIPAYVAAVCREIEIASRRWDRLTAPTIYFGGGTPSILSPDLLGELLRALRLAFHISDDAEITLEANPGTVDAGRLSQLRVLGINRLSLGVQSAHDDELGLLGRIHTWDEAVETVRAAREAGFDNLSLDFIFGLPGQTMSRWRETVEAALRLRPEHLSLYALSVEEDTRLEKQIAAGELPPPDEDMAAEMYELAEERLAEAGYWHYEISNWATAHPQIPNPYMCRHNLTYWRNEFWLGVGAGAHSWMGGQRWANAPHPREYVAALERGDAPVAETEPIDRRLEMGETMMMGLRLAEGVADARFRARFGVGLEAAFGESLAQLQSIGLLVWDGYVARLTARGRLLGNQVFMHFL
jgi:oxygen-independent coproporphyrinogen-3 oxidase